MRKTKNTAVYHVRCVLKSEPGFEWTSGKVNNSLDAAELVGFIRDSDREHLVVLCLSNKNVPLAYAVAAMGAGNTAQVSPAEMLRIPLLAGASTIIIAHNHPSGDTIPSHKDRQITEKIAEACRLLGLRFLDHIVVGPAGGHYSFADAGQMPGPEKAES